MDYRRSLVCKNYFIFVTLLILLVIVMLSGIAKARLEAFHQHHIDISHESASGVEKQVAFYITEKQRMVEVFAEEQIDWLRALAQNPNNDELHQNLGVLLTRYFPDRFAFSITDSSGEPLFEDFDGLISERCLIDVKEYSSDTQDYLPYIHPNPEGYHFDVMVRFGKEGKEGILLVSFLADVLGEIINSIQSHNHQVMLVMPQHKTSKYLIEVISEGARNRWIRDDYRLSDQEQARVSMRHDIPGTRWQAIDFHNIELHTNYRNKLIWDSIGIFIVFLTIALLLVIRLRREERQREAAEQQKLELMSVVSHEFRSPTAVIKGALDLVSDGDAGAVSADVKKYIDMALASTSQLMRLVNDFLDLQKIESGNLTLNKVPTPLKTVVSNSVVRNGLYAEQFLVHYTLIQPLADGLVDCDEQRIEQVMTNFLSNAAKYGGHNDNIEISVSQNSNRLRVSVKDHGPGIPEDFQPRVFEKFAMNHSTPVNKKKGRKIQSSGLGLSIAKAIIEQHGGSIGFDTTIAPSPAPQNHRHTVNNSTKNDTTNNTPRTTDGSHPAGTTFWFELPTL
ncbi:MAG: hypothetical protein COB30_007275 [Ectothiorhodospiraceae bacterium]|nr:hypothetical protein [Ectothiorhodospiraceae bacterium]